MQSKGRLQALMSFETAAEADAFRDQHILPRIAESWFKEKVLLSHYITHTHLQFVERIQAINVESCMPLCCRLAAILTLHMNSSSILGMAVL
jgi:cystathionine beta-lyase/cystathionine gamma-synthase